MGNTVSTPSGTGTGSSSLTNNKRVKNNEKWPLSIGDRVVWMYQDEKNNTTSLEYANVRWLGTIDDTRYAGIELDNNLGLGSGWFENHQLFTCEMDHGALVSIDQLIKEEVFELEKNRVSNCDNNNKISDTKPRQKCPSKATNNNKSKELVASSSAGDVHRPVQQNEQPMEATISQKQIIDTRRHKHLEFKPDKTNNSPPPSETPTDDAANEEMIDISPNNRQLSIENGKGDEPIQENYRRILPIKNGKGDEPSLPSPSSLPPIKPPFNQKDLDNLCGTPKGIECHNNSCYMDSTLFCMFGFSSVFDYIVQPNSKGKTGKKATYANEIKSILLNSIINPLRTHYFVPYQNIMELRHKMKTLNPNIISSEMDAQEFLDLLFNKALKIPEFLKFTNGQNDHFHQILVPENPEEENNKIPTVQLLLERSFDFQALKLKTMPDPVLILQMPRHGIEFKMFDAILPNLTIDMTNMLAQESGDNSNTKMELYAVICIETNHFTSFIRCGNNSNGNSGTVFTKADSWVFFDSLFGPPSSSRSRSRSSSTERPSFMPSLNASTSTPTITNCPSIGIWLDELERRLQEFTIKEVENFKSDLRTLLSDVYMCFYVPSSSSAAASSTPLKK